MSQSVFISYASIDRKIVTQIHDVLSRSKFDVWFDVKRLESGEPLHHEILSQIQPDTAFVLIHSKNSSQSEWVQLELSTAINSRPEEAGGIFLVLLDDTPIPKGLHDVKFIDLRESFPQEIKKLRRGIFKWSKKSHLYAKPNTKLSGKLLIVLPSLMAPFMAVLTHIVSETFSILPSLSLHTEKIPIGSYLLTLMYGFFAGPVLAFVCYFASSRGALKSTGYTEAELASLYQKQQVKLLWFFTWMGFWMPILINSGLNPNLEAAPALLITSFVGPFLVTGIGVIMIDRYPGPNPLLP